MSTGTLPELADFLYAARTGAGQESRSGFDGHANRFIESGKALPIDSSCV